MAYTDKKKESAKKFRESEKGIAYRKKWHEDNKERSYELKKKYNKDNKEYLKFFKNRAVKKYRKNKKEELFNLLGGFFCAECGCNLPEALELNHINGGSYKERKVKNKLSCSYSARLVFLKNNPEEIKNFNILCRICNAHHYLRDLKKINGGTFQIIFTKEKDSELLNSES